MTRVALAECYFGSQADASQVLAAFETNTSVTDLTIERIGNLEGTTLGNSYSAILQNMAHLQRLHCYDSRLRVEGVRAFQPALQMNRTLNELSLWICVLGNVVFASLRTLWLKILPWTL